jgi:hypothetical protein
VKGCAQSLAQTPSNTHPSALMVIILIKWKVFKRRNYYEESGKANVGCDAQASEGALPAHLLI